MCSERKKGHMPFFFFTAVFLSKYNTTPELTAVPSPLLNPDRASAPVFLWSCPSHWISSHLEVQGALVTITGNLMLFLRGSIKFMKHFLKVKKKIWLPHLIPDPSRHLNPGISMTFICLKHHWNKQAGERVEILAGTLASPAMTGKTVLAVAIGWDNQEWCQIRGCISPLLPFKSPLSAWTMNWEIRVEGRTTKTFYQGASDGLLRGHSWLGGESPPQKYCQGYSFSGASSASWKQSRELSSSGQWGLAARPGNEGRDEKEHGSQIALVHAVPGDQSCRKGRVYSMPRSRVVGPCIAVMGIFLLEEWWAWERFL